MSITKTNKIIFFIVLIIFISGCGTNGLTDTYDNYDCLNKCYEINNWTDGSHKAYSDCSDMCARGEIGDE